MTGAEIVGALLRANPEFLEKVAEANIKAGMLPENVTLPAVLVRTISVIERTTLKRRAKVRQVERVQLTVRAGNRRDQVAIRKMAISICAGWTGDMAPAERISILNAGTGPELTGPGNSFEQGTDFRVSFDEPA
jgi:hypothetical protein